MKILNPVLAFAVSTVLVGTALTSFAAEGKKPLGPEAKAKLMAAIKARKNSGGGLVYGPIRGKMLEVVNHQSDIPAAFIESELRAIELNTKLPICLVAEKTSKAGVTLELIDTPTDPALVMTMDEGWSKLNVRKLHEGEADYACLTNRFHKQLWRGIGAALGVGVSSFQPCLMRNIRTMRELDNCPLRTPGPASLRAIEETSQYWGIFSRRIVSYRMACQEGWAPAPTNEAQKVIWEKAKAEANTKPTNPMRIIKEKK